MRRPSLPAKHSIYYSGGKYIKLSLATCREWLEMPSLQWGDLTAEMRQVLQEIYRVKCATQTGGSQ